MAITYCPQHGAVNSERVCSNCLGPVCDHCAGEHPQKVICHLCRKRRRQKGFVFGLILLLLVLGGASYPLFFSDTARLQRDLSANPCSETLSYRLASHFIRLQRHVDAGNVLSGYFAECGESRHLRELHYELNKYLGNHRAALVDIGQLIVSDPYNKDYWGWQGQTYQSLNDPQRAVFSFRQALKIEPALVGVPMRIVHLLQAQGKYCEAYLELNRYADVVPDVRKIAQVRFMFKDLYQKGQCQDQFSTAKAVIHFPPGASSIFLKVKFNGGEEATMVLDTGASFVSLSRSFARKIGVKLPGKPIQLLSANGIIKSELIQVDEISVDAVTAKKVDVAITDQEDFGRGAVGLLGMAFLSRFNVTIDSDRGVLQLESRSLSKHE